MNSKNLVSVIVPVYNAEHFIEKCIHSILNQSYKNIELILVNDGSTDNSVKICDSFAKIDNRVKLIHQANSGPSVARNNGIDNAKGKYIQFIDADDYIEENMIETLVNEMEKGLDIVLCGYKQIFKEENKITNTINSKVYYQSEINKELFLKQFGSLFKEYYINFVWNKLYKIEIIKNNKIRFNSSISWGEDLFFNLDYLNYCKRISIIDGLLYNYVKYNNNSITSKFNEKLYSIQQNMYQAVREFLIINNSYFGENKDIVEKKFTDSVIICINNLFHKDAKYNKAELKQRISDIINDEVVNNNLMYFKNGGIQKKIVGKLISNKSVEFIVYYFTCKNYIKNHMKFIYKILKNVFEKV